MIEFKDFCNSLIMNDSVFYKRINDKIEYYSYGCPDSRWDLETIINNFDLDSIKDNTIFIDTCAATEPQEIISKRLVSKLSKLYPNHKLIVSGCGVNYDFEYYSKYGLALKNSEKFNLGNYLFKVIEHDKFKTPHAFGSVKIQDGCFRNCSYCYICKARPHYLFSYEEISKQIRACIDNGETDILLFGTEICDWKDHDNHDLVWLCKKILKDFREITSLKLDSINPRFDNIEALIELIKKEPKFHSELDLSVQSCSNTMIKSVNRFYTVEKLKWIKELCADRLFISYQLIIGLPGETEELWKESFNNLKELNPNLITLCQFSPRKGTLAYTMPNQIPQKIKEKRELIIRKNFNTVDYDLAKQFAKYRPFGSYELIEANLYDFNEVVKLFNKLKSKENAKDIVIVNNFDYSKDQSDLELNIKLLILNFGVRIITKIKLNSEIINKFNLLEYSHAMPTFLDIDFDYVEDNVDMYKLISLFRDIKKYNLNNVNLVLKKLWDIGNRDLVLTLKNDFGFTF